MIRRLLAGYLTITVLVMLVLGLPLAALYARHERARLVDAVTLDATEAAAFAALPIALDDPAALREVTSAYGRATPGRMVVVDRAGLSLADSHDQPERSFATRTEVQRALKGSTTSGFRHSDSLGRDLFFVAVPVNSGAIVLGAVRITYPAAYVEERIRRSWAVLAGVALAVVACVATVSLALARTVSEPVRALERAAARLGEGDLTARAAVTTGPPEVRSLARSFDDTAAKLDRLMQAQRRFVADASHQLRTPLTAMRLDLENLGAVTTGPAQASVVAALHELKRLTRILDGLLIVGRADSVSPAPSAVDVDRVVADRLAIWSTYAEEQGVRLSTSGRAGTANITPDSLDQALDNLLANAIDAAPRGGGVDVAVGRDGGSVHIHVVDDGPGMTEDQRARAFTRFASSGGAGTMSVGGFGIGLAIARSLVLRDGGDLTLDAAPTGGLDAHLRLPAGRG